LKGGGNLTTGDEAKEHQVLLILSLAFLKSKKKICFENYLMFTISKEIEI
jgi:hypothetical protein